LSAFRKRLGPTTVLEVACKFFETSADEDLYVAVDKASPKKLTAFLECYRDIGCKGVLDPPQLESNTLRPYLISDDQSPWYWGNFSFGFSTFDDADRVWTAVDAIKHRLLYCHSVAVDFPLDVFFMRSLHRDISEQDVRDKRTNILNFFNFILHMKPLIERGVFSLVTDVRRLESTEHRSPLICDLFRKFGPSVPGFAYSGEFPRLVLSQSEIDEFYRQAPKLAQELWSGNRSNDGPWGESFLVESSLARILGILDTFARAPNSLSLYFPFRADIRAIAAFQENIRRSLPHNTQVPEVHDRDSRLLTQLVDMNVPGIADLPIEDIVAIRDADAFANWRNELTMALQYASSIPSDLMDYDRAARAAITEMLEPSRQKLEEEFKKSAFLVKVREAAVTMACGSVGALVGYSIDPSVGALIGGIAGSATDVAMKLVRTWMEEQKRGSRAARAAAISHYVALLS
jgi:hypothetical protein